MKANNSLRINMPRALELISFFFLGHGPTYPISDLSGSVITKGNCNQFCYSNCEIMEHRCTPLPSISTVLLLRDSEQNMSSKRAGFWHRSATPAKKQTKTSDF